MGKDNDISQYFAASNVVLPQNRNKYKILLVEDDAEISEMLKNYLATENYDVVCAFDGQEACNMFDAAAVHTDCSIQ